MGSLFLVLAGGWIGYHFGAKHADRKAWWRDNAAEWRDHAADWRSHHWGRLAQDRREAFRTDQAGYDAPPLNAHEPEKADFAAPQSRDWARAAAESSVLDTAENSLRMALGQVHAFRAQYGVERGRDGAATPPLIPRGASSPGPRDV